MTENANKKTRAMTLTYVVETGLYVNITNKCSNRCDFCIRNNADGAYGSDSLWLEREPTVDEVLDSVFSRNLAGFSEIVFCGYGEPSERLSDVRLIAEKIKAVCPDMKIRINTNGQSDLISGFDTAPLYDVFDEVSISLNSSDAEGYQRICHSVYGVRAFDAILEFASNVKKYAGRVKFSVVREALTESELCRCKKIADDCGVQLRIRDLIT